MIPVWGHAAPPCPCWWLTNNNSKCEHFRALVGRRPTTSADVGLPILVLSPPSNHTIDGENATMLYTTWPILVLSPTTNHTIDGENATMLYITWPMLVLSPTSNHTIDGENATMLYIT